MNIRKEEVSTLEDVDGWLARHTRSATAKALDTHERWIHTSAWYWWRERETIIFPWPQEIEDAETADAWAYRAERLAAEYSVDGDMAKGALFFAAGSALGALIAAMLGGHMLPTLVIIIFMFASLGLVKEWGRQAWTLAPAWGRRAEALRLRSVQLQAPPHCVGSTRPETPGFRHVWTRRRRQRLAQYAAPLPAKWARSGGHSVERVPTGRGPSSTDRG